VTLRYPYEVRQPEEYFDTIDDEKVPKDMLDLAIHIVDTKRGSFEPQKFEDHYENALKELLRKKQKGEKIERPREPARTNVANLMEALRQSVKAAGGKSSATRAQSKKGKKRIEGQREMLLPIPGKKDNEPIAKSTARPSGRHRKTG
jgi:DNA end-binding protein Ku